MEQITQTLQNIQLSQGIVSTGLLMARILSMVYLAPFLGGKMVPQQVKIGIGLTIALIIYPIVVLSGGLDPVFKPTGPSYPFAIRVIGFLVKEVFVGFILGFIIHTIWHATEMIGRFVDTARGSAMGTALVPQMQAASSVFASLYYQMLIVIFLFMDGHLIFIEYFIRSYEIIPVAGIPRFDTGLWPMFNLVIRITADLFGIAITLAGPVMISIFITDICMGLFNKVAPQINVLFLMMPFKAILGILFSMIAIVLFIQQSEHMMARTLSHLWTMINYLAPF